MARNLTYTELNAVAERVEVPLYAYVDDPTVRGVAAVVADLRSRG